VSIARTERRERPGTQQEPGQVGAHPIVCRVAYPALLAAVVVLPVVAIRAGWDYGPVTMLFLIGTITYLLLLERVIPFDRAWYPTRREWWTYAAYFLISMVAGALSQLPTWALLNAVARPEPVLPLWCEIPAALLVGSLASYAVHRLGHSNRWLWRLHGVHHAPQQVNVATNGVNQVWDVFLAQAFVQLSLALAGFSAQSVFAVGIFVIAQGYFVHANIDVRLGVLSYVLAGPEAHRLHHSTDLAEAGHYGADLVIWDLAFGSFTWAPGRRPRAVGLADPASFPPTSAVLTNLLTPWRRGDRDAAVTPLP
jgi:sterol desaturase/sphingolipid hydroxylase (fatty acid hydroxylase superfamily)